MLESIQSFDFSILDWIQEHIRCDALDWIVPKITALGNAGIIWILLALTCLSVRRWRKCGISMATALILGLLIGNVAIKLLAARERPCWINPPEVMLIAIPKDYSFPSCHTLSSFAASVSLLRYHRKWGTLAVILAALIALTRLYLYVHFPSDVFVGLILGVSIALLACRMNNRYIWRFLWKTFPKLLTL